MSLKWILLIFGLLLFVNLLPGQTTIPNAGFEDWTSTGNFSDPVGWDTPNEELMMIPFFGFSVVTKSTDHHGSGSYSARLETRHLAVPPLDIPGFMTCGTLTVDIGGGSFVLSGGVPVYDLPTHLKGYFKYFPKGGDSCVIGIGLTKTTGLLRDTVGLGSFSTKDTVSDWTPFSAWIDYQDGIVPDTMNIIAMSTAQEVMTIGTTLYVDDLYLDYTVETDCSDPSAGINIYYDRETGRLMIFYEFREPERTTVRLLDLTGREVLAEPSKVVKSGRQEISCTGIPTGVYLLQVAHDNKIYSKKYFLHH